MTTSAPIAGTRAYLRLVLFGALIGGPAALLAAAFLALVRTVQHWLWHDVPAALGQSSPPWYLVLGLPLVGAAIVAAGRKLLPGDGGHAPLAGLSTASLPLREIPGVAVAAFGTLVFGAVLGPEAPLIALGCAVGAVVAALARLDARPAGLLTTSGGSRPSRRSSGARWSRASSWSSRAKGWVRRSSRPCCPDWSRPRSATSSSSAWGTGAAWGARH